MIEFQLSNGSILELPDGTSPEAMKNFAARAEAKIASQAQQPTASPQQQVDPKTGIPVQDIGDHIKELRAAEGPYSFNNTADRIVSNNLVTGIHDIGTGIYNAAQRWRGKPEEQAQPWSAQMLENSGAVPLPEDASTFRRFAEGAASAALFGGGRRAVTTLRTAPTIGAALPSVARNLTTDVALPVAGGMAGGTVLEGIADAMGYDKETGNLIGSLVGGAGAASAPRMARGAVERHYNRNANPRAREINDAYVAEGMTPTGGALGNDAMKAKEKMLASLPGGRTVTNRARDRSLGEMNALAEEIAVERGAGPNQNPQPGQIGQQIVDTATEARDRLRADVSGQQETMFNQIGAGRPTDVTSLIDNTRRTIGDSEPGTSRPLSGRLADLEAISRPGIGGRTYANYGPLKDWRTNLRVQREGQSPVSGSMHETTYNDATSAMRDTAGRSHVGRQAFDDIQQYSSDMSRPEGPIPYFSDIAGGRGRSGATKLPQTPEQAFNRVMGPGEQSPGRFYEPFETHGNPAATDQIFGDTLRYQMNRTLGRNRAAGPRQAGEWINNMDPAAQQAYGGNRTQSLRNLGTAAEAFDYAPQGAGLSRSIGQLLSENARPVLGSALAGLAATAFGGVSPIISTIGSALLAASPLAKRNIQARMLQSPTARRGFIGDFSPTKPALAELITAINAAQAAHGRAYPW